MNLRGAAQFAFLFVVTYSVVAGLPARADLLTGIAAYSAGDWQLAMSELEPLAVEGQAEAQFYVGFMYETGKGVPVDLEQAAQWYLAAAEQGEPKAQFNLAAAYESARGVKTDLVQTHRWYLASAESGFLRAQYKVAEIYLSGAGLYEPDLIQAHKWFNLCGRERHRDARKRKRRVAHMMDPYDLAEAELQARLWSQAHR